MVPLPVPERIEYDFFPDLVGDDDEVVLARGRRDDFEFVGAVQPARGVVRIVEQNRAGWRPCARRLPLSIAATRASS